MRTMSPAPGRAPESSEPTLVAEAIYLRPAARATLLQVLAELGVFVREAASPRLADAWRETDSAPDFMVVTGEGTPEQARLVRYVATERRVPVTVIVPASAQVDVLLQAGAIAAAVDGDEPGVLREAVRMAAEAARANREGGGSLVSRLIFGSVELQASPAALAAGSFTVRLSPVEFQVLADLVQARGRMVASRALEVHLGGRDRAISRGYLKSVIGRIRRKVELLGGDPVRLVSVRGAGYRLDA